MWSNLASVLSNLGKFDESIACRQLAVSLEPENLEFGFYLATDFIIEKRWGEAKEVLGKLIEKKMDWPAALLNLGNCEKNLGNNRMAEQLYLRTLEIAPNLPELHSNLGALFSENDRAVLALDHHTKAVSLQPDNPLFHYNLGNGYWALGHWGEAAAAYSKALELRPNLIQARMNLGTALLISGDLDGALEHFKLAEAIDPKQSQIYTSVGYISSQLRRHDEAVAYFLKAIGLEQDNISAWSGLANSYMQLGRVQEAMVAAQTSLEYDPRNGLAWLELAKIEERLCKTESAEIALLRAMEKPEKMGLYSAAADQRQEARFRLANLYITQGREHDATKVYKAGMTEVVSSAHDLRRYPEEQGEKRLVLLRPIGRSGSLFLQSLIDGHPAISTTPGVILKGFFGKTQWEGLRPIFSEANWRDVLIERFVKIFAPLFDAESPTPIPGNPMGESIRVGKAMGLTTLGPQRDQVLKIDLESFKSRLFSHLKEAEKVSAPRFFELVHETWDECLGWKGSKPVIFFHIHNPDPMEMARCLAGFEDVRLLAIVREPLQSIESWMRECLAKGDTSEALLYNYVEAVARCNELLCATSNVAHSLYPSGSVRLEDIKRQPEKTLPMLSRWMGVDDHPCLRQPTFAGLEYDAPSSTPVKGFETSNLDRKPGALFSEYDQRVMNLLLYPIAVQYGYRDDDPAHLAGEIAWYKPLMAEPLDFERKIHEQLAEMGYQKDVTGPRSHLHSISQRCIHLLEQFGTYPAMAPWLKVE